MIRAAMLDSRVYEEVEHDPGAMGQAVAVVLAMSLAPGLVALNAGGIRALVLTTLAALFCWVVWALLTYMVGTRLLPEPETRANLAEMLRTTAFSAAPGVICILGLLPIAGLMEITVLVALGWMVLAMVLAVRQALDYRSTARAFVVCLIALLIVFLFGWLTEPNPFVGTAV